MEIRSLTAHMTRYRTVLCESIQFLIVRQQSLSILMSDHDFFIGVGKFKFTVPMLILVPKQLDTQ